MNAQDKTHSNVVTTLWSTDRDRIQPAPAQHTNNCPPSGSTWIYSPCETFLRQARRKFSRFHVSTRRGSSLTYLSTPVRPPTEWGRNCKGTKWSSLHQISRGWNHRWSVQNSVVPSLEIEDEDSPIEYQGAIINWLQREYGEHVEVIYTL